MAEEVRVWQVGSNDELMEVGRSKLDLEDRIEKWIERDISVLDQKLLVIGEQVETAFGKFIDLLCMDSTGNLVIVELKRDKTPRDVTAQAIDYASWVKDLDAEDIQRIAAEYFKNKGTGLTARGVSLDS
jgi:RecB family endonuclease NucS